MFKPKTTRVDMMQKKIRYIFKIPLIISLGIGLAIMIDQIVYGTGGFYESYYTFAPYSKTAPYGTHDGTNKCFDCHYGHGDDKTRTEFLTAVGVGVDACGVGGLCHTAAGNIIGKPDSPVELIYNGTNSPYQGIAAYKLSAHNTVTNMFWPGAASTISGYLQVSSDVTDAEGACFNCHNPHGQPDPDSGVPATQPFLCKAVAGIDVCFVKDTGQTVNGIIGNSAGGVDPDTAENLCYACHGTLGTGTPKPTNYDYSDRTTAATIQAQFGRLSHHPVKDSEQSSTDDPAVTPYAWKVECNVCHNPHICQKSTRDSSTASPITRVTDNTTLWGDDADEKMSYITSPEIYQAPSGEPTAANLTNFNAFCLDCHEVGYDGLSHDPIYWGVTTPDKHGKGAANVGINIDSPYSGTDYGKYVLACTDCHEPHGSANVYLTRTNVNGAALSQNITAFATTDWQYLCARCHDCDSGQTLCDIHHNPDYGDGDNPYGWGSCGIGCHTSANKGGSSIPCNEEASASQINCTNCHFHGSDDSWSPDPTGRRTF